jgi:hypothetical protein
MIEKNTGRKKETGKKGSALWCPTVFMETARLEADLKMRMKHKVP